MAFQLFFPSKRRSAHQPLSRRRARFSFLAGIKESHRAFWRENPALLAAISLLIATSSLLFWNHLLWAVLWIAYLCFCNAYLQIAPLAAALIYGWVSIPPHSIPSETSALFTPSALKPHASPFQKGVVYKGTLRAAQGSVNCCIPYLGNENERPLANQSYFITGKLQMRSPADWVLKPKKWTPAPNTWSLAEMRYQTKETFRKFLKEKLPSRRAASFLGSLTTGDVEERMLRFEFTRLGLQHILAISGFHFGILIAFCSFSLGLFLPRIWRIGLLFLAINAYFLFVGSAPSIQRSWLTALFFLLGQYLNRPSSSLNLLGCALAAEILYDPLISIEIGFQLSFLSCAGILFFHPPIDYALRRIIPKRNRLELLCLTPLQRHISALSSFFRSAFSLTLSVNLVLFPLLLFHFQQFPLLSLLYNIFYPFLVGAALFILLLALIAHLLSPLLALPLFYLLDSFASLLLDLASYPPLVLDFSIGCPNFPAWAVPPYLFILFALNLFFTGRIDDFSFKISSIKTRRS